jgi:hypothetical protein
MGGTSMRFTMHRIGRTAGALALAGGVLVATALPAAAASPNKAYGAAATGLISQSPLGEADFPGTSPVTLLNANIAGLLTTGIVTDTAGPTSASSVVNKVSAGLGKLVSLTAASVRSSCSFNTNTGLVSGTATIIKGAVGGVLPITLASHPAKNTTVSVPGIATLTLNKHTTALDGTLTVTAIYVSLVGSTQTLSLGVSVCNAANLAPVPILPGRSAQIALGAVVLLALIGLGYQISTRRRRAAAA